MPETLTVHYARKFSDGQFGSEEFSLGLTLSLNDGEAAEELLNDGTVHGIAARVRRAVLSELALSESPRVAAIAQAELEPALSMYKPSPRAADDGDTDDEVPF